MAFRELKAFDAVVKSGGFVRCCRTIEPRPANGDRAGAQPGAALQCRTVFPQAGSESHALTDAAVNENGRDKLS